MNSLDVFLFIALPYVAIALFVVGAIYRYRARSFTYSSLSSQFLEGARIYIFAVLFHWGILMVFLAHLIAFLFPATITAWYSNPMRLIASEVIMVAFGFGVLIGMAALLIRRIANPRIRLVSSRMDIVIELVLLVQIALGLYTALGYRWGYYWFASNLSPYLWSIVKLNPKIDAVAALPWMIKAHLVGAFLILGLTPFSRLAHFLVAPIHYLWRPYQRVIWSWNHTRVRDPMSGWSETAPKNN